MKQEYETQFVTLLEGLIDIGEKAKGVSSGDDRYLDAEGLLLKMLYHCGTAFYLSKGKEIPEMESIKPSYLDPSSLHVITRAAIESYIVFHYVFIQPETKEEKDFRYWIWVLCGLIARQRTTTTRPELIERLKEDKKEISKLTGKLNRNSVFDKLEVNQQNKILNKGEWRLPDPEKGYYPNWSDLASSAGLSEAFSKDAYGYLAEYAHSTSWSVQQVREMRSQEPRRLIIDTSLEILMSIMALSIKAYVDYFPVAKQVLENNEILNEAVETWSYVGTTEPENNNP